MPKLRDEAVCIRRWDFSETSQTVAIFSRSHGLLRGLAKGAKRERGQFGGGIELLTRGEALFMLRKGRDLATITDWSLLEIFPHLSRSLTAHRAGLYFADLVAHLAHEEDPHERLFEALVESLRALREEGAAARTVLAFQWTALVEAGYRPILDRDARTGEALDLSEGAAAFSAADGGMVNAPNTADAWRVRAETIALLRRLEGAGSEARPALGAAEGKALEPRDEVLGRANRLLGAYIRHILDRDLSTMRLVLGEVGAGKKKRVGESG